MRAKSVYADVIEYHYLCKNILCQIYPNYQQSMTANCYLLCVILKDSKRYYTWMHQTILRSVLKPLSEQNLQFITSIPDPFTRNSPPPCIGKF